LNTKRVTTDDTEKTENISFGRDQYCNSCRNTRTKKVDSLLGKDGMNIFRGFVHVTSRTFFLPDHQTFLTLQTSEFKLNCYN